MKKNFLVSKVTGDNEYGNIDVFVLELDKHTLKRLRFMVWLSATIHLILRLINYIGQLFPLKGRVTPFRLASTGFQSVRFEFWGTWMGSNYEPDYHADDDDGDDDVVEHDPEEISISEAVEDLLPHNDWGVFTEEEIKAKCPNLLDPDDASGVRGHAVKVWHDGDIFFTAYDKHSGDDYETYQIDARQVLRAAGDFSLFERVVGLVKAWRKPFNQAAQA